VSPQELALSIGLFGVPALIFIAVIAGSRLRPQVKRRVETWFLMPLFVVVMAAGAAFAASERGWIVALVCVAFGALGTERLVRRLRELRRAPQTS
jgi:uncharacterized membrane protein